MVKDKAEGKAVENVSAYMQSYGGQRPDGRAELFTRAQEAVDLERFVRDSQADPRVWTVIVSPAHGNQLDLQQFARAFIAQVEADTKRSVDWLGAVHTNTDHPHVHLLIRGRDRRGEVVTFPPEYVQRGMRHRAMAMQERSLSRSRSVKASPPSVAEVRTRISQLVSQVTREPSRVRTRGASLGW